MLQFCFSIIFLFASAISWAHESCLGLDFSQRIFEEVATTNGINLGSEGFKLLTKYVQGEAELIKKQMTTQLVDYAALQNHKKLLQKTSTYFDSVQIDSVINESMNTWLKLNNAIRNTELISRSSQAVVIVHQANEKLQQMSVQALEVTYPDAAIVAAISGTFAATEKQYINLVQKRGTFVYTSSGRLNLAIKKSSNTLDVNAEEIILMGGICTKCLGTAVQSLVENFSLKKVQKKLTLTFAADLIYEDTISDLGEKSLQTLRQRLDEVPKAQQIFTLMTFYGTSVLKKNGFNLKNLGELQKEISSGKVVNSATYVDNDQREIVLQFR